MAYVDPTIGLVLTPQKTAIEAAVERATDILYFASITDFPAEGEIKKVYVDKNTLRCYCWDWINSTYVEISSDKAAVNLINDHINNGDVHVSVENKEFWNDKVSQEQLADETARAQEAEQAINDTITEMKARFKKEFVKEVTTKTLAVDTKYYVTAKLTATLPEDPVNGDELWVVVLGEGIATTVVAPEGTTINGFSEPMALNLDSMETTFVFDAQSNNWVMY